MYVIKNLNPKRDKFFKSNTGENYMKASGVQPYHTDVERATHFPSLNRAIEVMFGMEQSHERIRDTEGPFSRNHEMTKASVPHFVIRKLKITAVQLDLTEIKELQQVIANL